MQGRAGQACCSTQLARSPFSRTCNNMPCIPCGVHVLERRREGAATISHCVHLAAHMNCSAAHCSWSCIASQMQGRAGQESCSTHLARSHILHHPKATTLTPKPALTPWTDASICCQMSCAHPAAVEGTGEGASAAISLTGRIWTYAPLRCRTRAAIVSTWPWTES
jgi:hypothetical protein